MGSGCRPTDVRASHGPCKTLSIPGLRRNKKSGHRYKNPSHGHNKVSDTSGHPISATRSRPRNRCPHLCQGRHTRRPYPAALSQPEAPEILSAAEAAGEEFLYLYSPLPSTEWGRQAPGSKGLHRKAVFSFCRLHAAQRPEFLAAPDIRIECKLTMCYL
jgi:hypothetical protein